MPTINQIVHSLQICAEHHDNVARVCNRSAEATEYNLRHHLILDSDRVWHEQDIVHQRKQADEHQAYADTIREAVRLFQTPRPGPTASDFSGKPHVVIFQERESLRVVHFTGADAMEKAHACSMSGFEGCVTVALRIRQTCPSRLAALMS